MKKRAIIYTRVSTDEQADKGYSLKDQEDRLRKFCALKDIEIVAHYQEDHSAKTFERPEFKKLFEFAKKNRTNIDLMLFIKWDRFSRNAGDSYYMISQFGKISIECQAIEQPLDLAVPENKMMLAFYLAAPEVENDRRSMNTINGMRRAMKEGRWMNKAPIGYKNSRDERGGSIIIPSKDAGLVREAFAEMMTGAYLMEEVRKKLLKKGFKCCKNNFPNLLKNPVYIGKLFIPAFKDEESQVVQGIHEPLIDDDTFYTVQNILSGRKKFIYHDKQRAQLPLRGFFYCRKCGRKLTGSGSRGNGGAYFYYHCTKGCTERFRADTANDVFIAELAKLRADDTVINFHYEVLKDVFYKRQRGQSASIVKLKEDIAKNTARANSAQTLLLDGGLDLLEYKAIKKRYEEENAALQRELTRVELSDGHFLRYLEYDTNLFRGIDRYFTKTNSVSVKQKLLGSFFPHPIYYENEAVRTKEVCKTVEALCPKHGAFSGNKNGPETDICLKPIYAPRPGLEPGTP